MLLSRKPPRGGKHYWKLLNFAVRFEMNTILVETLSSTGFEEATIMFVRKTHNQQAPKRMLDMPEKRKTFEVQLWLY